MTRSVLVRWVRVCDEENLVRLVMVTLRATLAAACLPPASRGQAWAQTVDQFGGYLAATGHNTSGFFRIERMSDRYFLVTPDTPPIIPSAWEDGTIVSARPTAPGGAASTARRPSFSSPPRGRQSRNPICWVLRISPSGGTSRCRTTDGMVPCGLSSITIRKSPAPLPHASCSP
jgi:hypothetical protein